MGSVNKKSLLVIGGTGFIGSHLVQAASKQGWHVSSVSLHNPRANQCLAKVDYIVADVSDKKALKEALGHRKFSHIVNLGGYIDHANIRGGGNKVVDAHFSAVRNIVALTCSGQILRFVQIGSSDEYGDIIAPQRENEREMPISPYAFAKVASTYFLQMLHRTENLPCTTLRLFLTYGPGQSERRFLPQIIKGCLEDKVFPVSGGEQLRDFCYVDDTVTAILLALDDNRVDGKIINIGSGDPIRIRKVIEKVQQYIGKGSPQYGQIDYRLGENMALYGDIEQARELLNWEPLITLEEGLKKTIESIRRSQ
jgi:nucleoside-diphosphate-sugar epimerase